MVVALNSMEEDKVLGLERFPIKFLKECWDILGSETMAAINTFHS